MTENIHAFAARFIAGISDQLYDPDPQADGYTQAKLTARLTDELTAGITVWLREALPFVDELPAVGAAGGVVRRSPPQPVGTLGRRPPGTCRADPAAQPVRPAARPVRRHQRGPQAPLRSPTREYRRRSAAPAGSRAEGQQVTGAHLYLRAMRPSVRKRLQPRQILPRLPADRDEGVQHPMGAGQASSQEGSRELIPAGPLFYVAMRCRRPGPTQIELHYAMPCARIRMRSWPHAYTRHRSPASQLLRLVHQAIDLLFPSFPAWRLAWQNAPAQTVMSPGTTKP